jgi:hypothetical protein
LNTDCFLYPIVKKDKWPVFVSHGQIGTGPFSENEKTGELPVWKAAIPVSAFPERSEASDQFILNRKSPENLPVCKTVFPDLFYFSLCKTRDRVLNVYRTIPTPGAQDSQAGFEL